MTEFSKVWFITGASRGLGLELAKAAIAAGHIVIGTSRDGATPAALAGSAAFSMLPLEVTDSDGIRAAVAEAHRRHGRLDVVVNNAGYGLIGAIEEATDDQIRHIFEVNFYGTLNVVRATLPILRAQRNGYIVNITSMGGVVAHPGAGLYAASKFAVEGFSQALAGEVAPLGIKVMLVEPGAFRTDFLADGAIRFADRIADYADTAGLVSDRMAKASGTQRGDPAKAAQAIVAAVASANPPLHLVLGPDALAMGRAHVAAWTETLDAWENVSLSTDYPDGSRS